MFLDDQLYQCYLNEEEFPAENLFDKSETSLSIEFPNDIYLQLKNNEFARNRVMKMDKISSKTPKLHRLKLTMLKVIRSGEIRIKNFKRKVINDAFARRKYVSVHSNMPSFCQYIIYLILI